MAVELHSVAARKPSPPTSARAEVTTIFDERWARMASEGAAHDRVRCKLAIAAPLVIIVIAVVSIALIGR